ncbi:MAG: peptidase [Flavobacteriaceae bacterium]|nr:MAG: peptidase [Flavobacteriaceae bacterium]
MNRKLGRITRSTLLLLLGTIIGLFLAYNRTTRSYLSKYLSSSVKKVEDSRHSKWDKNFKVVEIESTMDAKIQKAFFYRSRSSEPKPLIISLHTWSAYYTQNDPLAKLSKQNDINYIHPNFRGENITVEACNSTLALSDIDDAIDYAKTNANVDDSEIHIVGFSGGGYATIGAFMKSRHRIKTFSAWASITDLIQWFDESKVRGLKYANDILFCTDSKNGNLNMQIARSRSPIYWETPSQKLNYSQLNLYAGINDGLQGSVPITQSINFYNKVLKDLGETDSLNYVSDHETLKLLTLRKPIADLGSMADRSICLRKKSNNITLTIFDGGHEILPEYAFNELVPED